eukprot:9363271-Alexandrium_andersonii.AAC.1
MALHAEIDPASTATEAGGQPQTSASIDAVMDQWAAGAFGFLMALLFLRGHRMLVADKVALVVETT